MFSLAKSFAEGPSYLVQDCAEGWVPERSRVVHFTIVNRHAQLTETALYSFHVHVPLLLKFSRHPGANHPLDRSDGAVTDGHVLHNSLAALQLQ